MKNKRKGIIALAIVLVLALGIGYAAASTSTININGSAAAVADDFSIIFDETHTITYEKSETTGLTVAGAYTNASTATMTVAGLKKTSDYATATYKVKNASTDLKADITATLSGDITSDNHFTTAITYSTDGTTFSATAPTNVAAGASIYVKVRVNLVKSSSDAIAAKTFTVAITGTATE